MTRTHVSEAELVEIGRKALGVMNRLGNLTDRLQNLYEKNRVSATQLENAATAADDARLMAIELSDQVDALCDFVRTSCVDYDQATL